MRSNIPDSQWSRYSTFYYCNNTLSQNLREIVSELIQAIREGSHRGTLLSLHGDLINALDRIWMRASEGIIYVESIAILRALRKVTCPDIESQLMKPVLDYRRILRDLRLFINTLDHLLIPSIKGNQAQYRAL